MNKKCDKELNKLNKYLEKSCESKVNSLGQCDGKESDCPCSSTGGSSGGKVDLVILMDSSGSMKSTWQAISDASGKLEGAVKDKCGTETRITKLFLDTQGNGSSDDGVPGSDMAFFGFTSHEKYIIDNTGYTGPFATNDTPAQGPHGEGEQGSRGIADVSNYFPWQEEACRSVLYISDEWLNSVYTGEAESLASIPIATNAANSNNVTVFTHLVDSGSGSQFSPANHPAIDNHYIQLAESTGGTAHIGDKPTAGLYIDLVSDAACNCGGGCSEIEQPQIKPCISISWGDSNCDCLETDDFEVLCVSVCNCYSNVTFNNFSINEIEITKSNGKPVQNLPDGTSSVQVVPVGPTCFGDILPCDEGEATCVHREFAINTRGAKEGEYQVKLHGICYDVSFNYYEESCFSFKLCGS